MKRAISIAALLSKKFKTMAFDGQWADAIGTPEMSGVWLVWGQSGHGKTDFTIQIMKYISRFGHVVYNTLEEGTRKSMQDGAVRHGLTEVARRVKFLDREPMDELIERLKQPKSPDVIIIDSLQYSGLNKEAYKQLKEQFKTKLFVFISHADGRLPDGRVAKFVRYDADVKIFVEGYVAKIKSRYGGGADFTIWHKGAKDYWNNN